MPPITEERIREIIREELETFIKSDRYVFEKLIQITDGRNFQFGKGVGTKLGLSSSEKLAFHGSVPSVQQSKINDPSGGATQDAEARTAINALIDASENKGLTAT